MSELFYHGLPRTCMTIHKWPELLYEGGGTAAPSDVACESTEMVELFHIVAHHQVIIFIICYIIMFDSFVPSDQSFFGQSD